MKMKKYRLMIVLATLMSLAPVSLHAQDSESLYNGWSMGFQVGAGAMVPTGSLADDFKSVAVFTGGLSGGYNNLRLKADVTYGQPSFKNNNPYGVIEDQGRDIQLNGTASVTQLGLRLQLGYTVWRTGKVSVTPCVGVNWNRLSWDLNDIKWEKNDEGVEQPVISSVRDTHENSWGWMASVDLDFALHGKMVDAPLKDQGSAHYESVLRVSPFVARASYSNLSPSVKGCYVGLTVSYAGLMRLLNY